MKLRISVSFLTLFSALALSAQTHVMEVNTKKVGAPVQSTMYGIFFEDINYAADGGLYAEMVKNRSFEFPQSLMGWRAYGKFEVRNDGPFDRNPHYVRLSNSGHRDKFTGLENEGFFGIAVKKDATYRFSLWARCPEGGKSTLEVSFVDNDTMGEDQRFATVKVNISGKDWKKYTAELKAPRTEAKGALRIFLAGDKETSDKRFGTNYEFMQKFAKSNGFELLEKDGEAFRIMSDTAGEMTMATTWRDVGGYPADTYNFDQYQSPKIMLWRTVTADYRMAL